MDYAFVFEIDQRFFDEGLGAGFGVVNVAVGKTRFSAVQVSEQNIEFVGDFDSVKKRLLDSPRRFDPIISCPPVHVGGKIVFAFHFFQDADDSRARKVGLFGDFGRRRFAKHRECHINLDFVLTKAKFF